MAAPRKSAEHVHGQPTPGKTPPVAGACVKGPEQNGQEYGDQQLNMDDWKEGNAGWFIGREL